MTFKIYFLQIKRTRLSEDERLRALSLFETAAQQVKYVSSRQVRPKIRKVVVRDSSEPAPIPKLSRCPATVPLSNSARISNGILSVDRLIRNCSHSIASIKLMASILSITTQIAAVFTASGVSTRTQAKTMHTSNTDRAMRAVFGHDIITSGHDGPPQREPAAYGHPRQKTAPNPELALVQPLGSTA